MSFKHTTARYQSKTFTSVRSADLIIGSTALKFSVIYQWKSSVTIRRIKLLLQKLCHWNLKFSSRNRKCAKWMEISGCKIDWHCPVGYRLIGQSPKRRYMTFTNSFLVMPIRTFWTIGQFMWPLWIHDGPGLNEPPQLNHWINRRL